jgi:NitT/TauT family transport system substrate-binding protein
MIFCGEMMNKIWRVTFVIVILAALVSGCAAQPAKGPTALRIAALPILDSLPLYVAEQEGLFTQENLQVEIIPVGSGPERDQLIAAGQADAMINEMVSVIFFNKDAVKVQVVRYARAASSGAALFSILAGKDSGIAAPADLKGQPLGISDGTVIAYLTERMLAAEGLAAADLQTVSVPKLDARLALLNSGELKAAVLPEPLASLAVQQGAVVVLDDTRYPQYSFSTYTMRKEYIDQNPEAVKAFNRAVEEAVKRINADPAKYAQTLVDHKLLPQPLVGKFQVPAFVTAGVPDEDQFADALAWAKEKGYVSSDIAYKDCVTGDYLP